MCTNNTCNPDVDCPNKNDCPSGSDCTTGCGGNCSSDSSCNGSCGDCCDGTCNSTVPVSAVTVCPGAVTLKVGRWYHDLSAAVSPSGANQHVCWSSSNEPVASVHPETGYVYGVGEGTAVITATACADSSKCDSCTVTVEPVLVESITLDKTVLEIDKGSSYNMGVTVCPEDAGNKSLEWSSSDVTVATVSQEGVITAQSTGWTYIYATAVDGSSVFAVCAVKVISPATSVKIERSDFAVVVGDEPVLVAAVEPADANNVQWSSDNETVATVRPTENSRHGIVTTKAAGVVNITATSKADSGVADSCQITVLPMRITLDKSTLSVPVCESAQLTASVQLAAASDRTVIWESSDPDVATVDADGNVTAKWSGDATIKAKISGTDIFDTCVVTVPTFGPVVEFDTLHDAVWDFAKTQYNVSRYLRMEVGAFLYKKANGKFAYTDLCIGTPHECSPYQCRNDDLGNPEGVIHTHPNGEEFSSTDTTRAEVEDPPVPLFVVTPSHKVLVYHQYDEKNKKWKADTYASYVPFLKYDAEYEGCEVCDGCARCDGREIINGYVSQGSYKLIWEDHVRNQQTNNGQDEDCHFGCEDEMDNWPGTQL